MHIITSSTLRLFWEQDNHKSAKVQLQSWYTQAKHANWRDLNDVRQSMPSADLVGRLTVFNIGGNKYRLIVRIEYEKQTIYIRHVLTHAEYNTNRWKNDEWF